VYSAIPSDTQILITHTPPYGILDGDHHDGCPELRAAVKRLRPSLHVFGHVHSGYGVEVIEQTTYVNAALFGELGDLDKRAIVLDMQIPKRRS
jgi:Icc-related predicted phosphoesterase